ncbi:MAG: Fic family protein [Deltaproteobacteria bacterium]|nr:Fic family protein [Deltaproteobacteria bacterium]
MDNNKVNKIFTFKSGNFIFSRKFSGKKIEISLVKANILYHSVMDLPILPDLSASIREEIIRRSIFGTAALEGNPLTEEKVAQIISKTHKTKQMEKAEKEIRNLKATYDFVRKIKPSGSVFILSEDMIKKIHSFITKGIKYHDNEPGQYRNVPVKVGDANHGGVYTPPKCLPDIQKIMKEFVIWINSEEVIKLEPEIRSALAHYHLGLIHPFGDGNGRTARIIEAMLLRLAGIKYVPIMLSNFYYRNIDDYFWAFSRARKRKDNDISPFLEFVLDGVINSLYEIKGRITFFIRKFTLRVYYDYIKEKKGITQRQHDFLIMLWDYQKPFTLEDLLNVSPFKVLYRGVSERTARRDLKKLRENNLLYITDDGKFNLNERAIG